MIKSVSLVDSKCISDQTFNLIYYRIANYTYYHGIFYMINIDKLFRLQFLYFNECEFKVILKVIKLIFIK